MYKILLLLFLMLLSTPASSTVASTYYVSPTGNDSKDGLSPANAWKTISKVNSISFNPGESILFEREGTFQGRISVKSSGTTGFPISYAAYGTGNRPIIDGSDTISITWVPAPEVGAGVYKTTDITYNPKNMTVDDYKQIPRINDAWMPDVENTYGMTGFEALTMAAGAEVTTTQLGITVLFWDGIDALYGYDNGITYIRFRDGDNPNLKTLKPSPYGNTLNFAGHSYVSVNNLSLYGGTRGVILPGGNNNIIDNCTIIGSQSKVIFENGVSDSVVSNCSLTPNFLSNYNPGPWSNGTEYVHGVREHIYNQWKYLVGTSSSDDNGIMFTDAGDNNKCYGNVIYNGLIGIYSEGPVDNPTENLNIYDNTIYNISSSGIVPAFGLKNHRVHDNLIHDCNINIRMNRLDTSNDSQRSHYIYNNKLYNPEEVGNHTYWHFIDDSPSTDKPYIYFYHNSFSGGDAALEMSYYAGGDGGLPNTLFVNNIFSSYYSIYSSNKAFMTTSSMVGGYNYNWVGGIYGWLGRPGWFGSNLIETGGASGGGPYPYFWTVSSIPDWRVTGTAAEGAGIDISQQFTIDGTAYDALPGFASGYFTGSAPDLGVVGPVSSAISSPKDFLFDSRQ